MTFGKFFLWHLLTELILLVIGFVGAREKDYTGKTGNEDNGKQAAIQRSLLQLK